MPRPNADLVMWSGGSIQRTAHRAAVRHADSMHRLARGIVRRTSSLALHLTRDAMRFIGTPYVFGGTSAGGFDCSGYVQHVYAMLGIALPRTADAQFYAGRPARGGRVAGDLVFFQTYEAGPSHVGIYLGHGRFIHSSSSRGVMISSIGDSYWSARYLGAKRVARVAPRLPASLAAR
ncbi:MAG: C40 family peptidase [Candidatus Eremiobacteraeota bacterium]|nr:C40 family peptidase [Candidatus Eremiobacteraeota bacterium]MBC5802099.1 C40 family peptidase [Candidatus Eremiobacteraeota bacterium]MBC5824323.1 C40 family peptidase [Candidatus Eremiobacteraeota bacterium]